MEQINQPDTKELAFVLAFASGATDVFCHLQFQALAATQTGNVILMATDFAEKNWSSFWMKGISIFSFTLGFLLGIVVKKRSHSPFWYTWTMTPLILVLFLLPLLPDIPSVLFALVAVGVGLLMLTFTGSQIEQQPYTIMMTSGNFRRMLSSWYDVVMDRSGNQLGKKIALNYTYLVLAFASGAVLSAYLYPLIHLRVSWLIGILLVISLVLYTQQVRSQIRSN